jgi:hypothetical protein
MSDLSGELIGALLSESLRLMRESVAIRAANSEATDAGLPSALAASCQRRDAVSRISGNVDSLFTPH